MSRNILKFFLEDGFKMIKNQKKVLQKFLLKRKETKKFISKMTLLI